MSPKNKIKLNKKNGGGIILKVTLVLAIGLTHSCGNKTKEKDNINGHTIQKLRFIKSSIVEQSDN